MYYNWMFNNKWLKKNIKLFIVCYLYFYLTSNANAQQTIFNVPSADVTVKGIYYTESEAQFRSWNPHKIFLFTQYNNLGIGHNTDIEATLYQNRIEEANRITMGWGFKSFLPIKKDLYPKRDFKWVLGSQILTDFKGLGTGNWTYSHLSGRLPVYNTRITSGLSFGTRQLFGRRVLSFIAGIEHPVTDHFSIIADWFSGTHSNGFFIPGFQYSFSRYSKIMIGFRVRNSAGSGSSGFVIEVNGFIPVFDRDKAIQRLEPRQY